MREGAVDRVMDVLVGLLVQLAAIAFRQQLGVGGHHAQRFLQIVRGHVGELLQVAIGAGQFLDLLGQRFLRPFAFFAPFLSFSAPRTASDKRARESFST